MHVHIYIYISVYIFVQIFIYVLIDICICAQVYFCVYIYIYIYHVTQLARISLTLYRHPSLSPIALGRSSTLDPVSAQSSCT